MTSGNTGVHISLERHWLVVGIGIAFVAAGIGLAGQLLIWPTIVEIRKVSQLPGGWNWWSLSGISLLIVGFGAYIIFALWAAFSVRFTENGVSQLALPRRKNIEWNSIDKLEVRGTIKLFAGTDCIEVNPHVFKDREALFRVIESHVSWMKQGQQWPPLTERQVRSRLSTR